MKYGFSSLLLVVLLFIASFSSLQAQASCSQSGTNAPIDLSVPNLTTQTLTVYWKDFTCVEVQTDTIAPGDVFYQQTYDGHEWVFRDPSGQIKHSFTTNSSEPTVVLSDTPFIPQPVTSSCSSAGTNIAIDLTIINNTDDPVLLYWIDFSCNEVFYAVVKGKDQFVQPTFTENDWVVRYMDGTVAEQVTVSPAKDTVIIDPPPTAQPTQATQNNPTPQPTQVVQNNPTAVPQTGNTTPVMRDVILQLDGLNYELALVNPDGTGTILFNEDADSGRFSPDGNQIVFYSDRDGDSEIFIMNADGSNLQQITNNTFGDVQPNFSPDGSQIVFASDRDGDFEIYIMNLDGSNPQRLTTLADDDRAPSISPDGTKIVFHHGPDGNRNIYIMNIDGTNMLPLTAASANNGYPRFSPDGSRIVFHSSRDANGSQEYDVYIMDADGRNQELLRGTLPKEQGEYVFPFFSPDGSTIVYTFYPVDTNLPTKIYTLILDSEQFLADGVGADWFSDASAQTVSQQGTTTVQPTAIPSNPTSVPANTTSNQFSGPAVQFMWNTDSFYMFNPGETLKVASVRFEEVDSNGQSTGVFFEGSRWSTIFDSLQTNFCNEIEISGRSAYLNPGVCQGVNARIGPAPADPVIFWNNASIRVLWNNTQIGVCPVSAGSCTLNLP